MMQPSGDLATIMLRDEYGSLFDWEMWRTARQGRLRIYVERYDVFPTGEEVFPPAAGGQGDFSVMG